MKELKVPFFVRFLETQESLEVKTDIKAGRPPDPPGGPPMVTMKFPSDDDENPIEI